MYVFVCVVYVCTWRDTDTLCISFSVCKILKSCVDVSVRLSLSINHACKPDYLMPTEYH